MEQTVASKKEPLGKGFYVHVSKNHTFGTDAVLLADFAGTKRFKNHCDLGTGCGIIPLILLRDQKTNEAYGVEISEEACFLAEKSSTEFTKGNFKIINSDLNDLKGKIPFGEFELVTCNPPYKANGAGILSDTETDKTARHETKCSLENVIEVSSKLLRSSGSLCLCQRPERLSDMINLMRQYKVEPKRLRIVCKKAGTEPWLVLLEGKRDAKSGMRIMPPLFVYEENGEYTKEMLNIYGCYKEGF
ncbi:MAG: methyltransferase [Clostridia bacterium]|nr:methyltransferase [Clostridia bacterium]